MKNFKPLEQLDTSRRDAIMQQAVILANMMYQVTAGGKQQKTQSESLKSESYSELMSVPDPQ